MKCEHNADAHDPLAASPCGHDAIHVVYPGRMLPRWFACSLHADLARRDGHDVEPIAVSPLRRLAP